MYNINFCVRNHPWKFAYLPVVYKTYSVLEFGFVTGPEAYIGLKSDRWKISLSPDMKRLSALVCARSAGNTVM